MAEKIVGAAKWIKRAAVRQTFLSVHSGNQKLDMKKMDRQECLSYFARRLCATCQTKNRAATFSPRHRSLSTAESQDSIDRTGVRHSANHPIAEAYTCGSVLPSSLNSELVISRRCQISCIGVGRRISRYPAAYFPLAGWRLSGALFSFDQKNISHCRKLLFQSGDETSYCFPRQRLRQAL